MGGGKSFVKYSLFVANALFALAGLALLGLGLYVRILSSMDMMFTTRVTVIAIAVGGVLAVIASFGCCGVLSYGGAIGESKWMLLTYSIFMMLLITAKVTLATVLFVKMEMFFQVGPTLDQQFRHNLYNFPEIEARYQCCGPRGPMSYQSRYYLPSTCCEKGMTTCTRSYAFPSCEVIISDLSSSNSKVIGIFTIIMASFELLAAVAAVFLANHVQKKDRGCRFVHDHDLNLNHPSSPQYSYNPQQSQYLQPPQYPQQPQYPELPQYPEYPQYSEYPQYPQ